MPNVTELESDRQFNPTSLSNNLYLFYMIHGEAYMLKDVISRSHLMCVGHLLIYFPWFYMVSVAVYTLVGSGS